MRIAFAGTPAFAATALGALLDAGREICVVLSQPDRPAGRGQQLQPSPVKQLARAHGLAVLTPTSLRPERGGATAVEAIAALRAAAPDILVVAAYGLLLPEAVLQLPRGLPLDAGRIGAVNIHASLLPRWRGAAPIVRAIEAGDTVTGITIMQMEAGLDTGPMLLVQTLDIAPDDTAGTLTEALARMGGALLLRALDELAAGRLQARAQPAEGVTYAHKVDKREAWIDWNADAGRLAARVRAFDPFPGACSTLGGQTVKLWRAHVVDAAPAAAPGTVESVGPDGVVVACGRRCLCLTQLQRPGGRRLTAREFLAGSSVVPGARWSGPPADTPAHPDGG
jgi:methionyl-tRNA formyltransferase